MWNPRYLILHLSILLSSLSLVQTRLSKCTVYEDKDDYFDEINCGGVKRIGVCDKITDIVQDLQDLPSNLLNLCLFVEASTPLCIALVSGVFSRFVSLEYLSIFGCFSQIPIGSFQGLTNLKELSIQYPTQCCGVAMESEVFNNLPSLKMLKLYLYNLSTMALNVFEKVPPLELFGLTVCQEDWSEIVCRLTRLQQVDELTVVSSHLALLKHPNCDIWNISDGETPLLQGVSNLTLDFNELDKIEQGALKSFRNLNRLSVPMKSNMSMIMNLFWLGITKLTTLEVYIYKVNLSELCELSRRYSIDQIIILSEISNTIFTDKNCDMVKGVSLWALLTTSPFWSPQFLDVNIFQNFTNLATLHLDTYVLNPYDFKSLCSSSPQSFKYLSELTLNSNNLKILLRNQFVCFANAEMADLSSNSIYQIDDFAFRGLTKLTFLSLHENKIVNIQKNMFSYLYSLKELDLQDNPISQIETNSFKDLANLQRFLLGDLHVPPNEQKVLLNLSDIFGGIPYNLSYMLISSGIKPMWLAFGSNETINQSLSLQIKAQSLTVVDCKSTLLNSIVHLKITSNYALCGSEFFGKYTRRVQSLHFISAFSDKVGDVSVINQLVHLRKLCLKNIDFGKQPNIAFIFHNLTKLKNLGLITCRMDFLDGTLTKDLKSLRSLFLIAPNSVKIYSSFVENLVNLRSLNLWDLHLHCSCDNAWLVSWITESQARVYVVNPSMQKLECLSKNGIDHINFVSYVKEDCSFEVEFVLFVFSSVSVAVFVISAMFHRFAGPYVIPLYHIAYGWILEALRQDSARCYRYDVFVSYSGKDERWVVDHFLPNLERRGPPFLQLCLHSRDFQLGQDIVDNITDSLYSSRRTLCLVSRNYLRSSWCSLELQLATYRLWAEHRDVLMLVFLEKVPSQLLSAHHRLARLVKTRTYLAWPQDPELHEAFWDKMWNKLRPKSVELARKPKPWCKTCFKGM